MLLFNPYEFPNRSVRIIGLGNIGSHTALTLGRLGIKLIYLHDGDHVAVHNLTSQAFDTDDLGLNKAFAISQKLRKINPDIHVAFNPFNWEGHSIGNNEIIVVAVDTMEGRKKIYEDLVSQNKSISLIVDARIGGNQLEVYTNTSLSEWQKTFVDNPDEDPCGGRFICYVSVIVGGLITNQIKKFLRGQRYEKSILMHLDSLEIIKGFKF